SRSSMTVISDAEHVVRHYSLSRNRHGTYDGAMEGLRASPSAATIVFVGLLALAAAMGVGRFAFTPLLPLMQAHDGLSLGQGAWLATANYLGYAAGALACSVRP